MLIKEINLETGAIEEVDIDTRRFYAGIVPIETVIPNPGQPREHFDEADAIRMTDSLKYEEDTDLQPDLQRIFPNQEEAVSVILHDDPERPEIRWMIKEGERRYRGVRAGGFRGLEIKYSPRVKRNKLFRSSFKANWNRVGHTHGESAKAIHRLREEDGLTYAEISRIAGKESPSWAVNEHRLLSLHPDIFKLLDPPTPTEQRIPINTALLLAPYSHEQQLKFWKRIKGIRKSEMYQTLRGMLTEAPATERVGRDRKPSDDERYVKGKLHRGFRDAEVLANLSDETLSCFSGKDVDFIIEYVKRIGERYRSFRLRIARLGKSSDLTERVIKFEEKQASNGDSESIAPKVVQRRIVSPAPEQPKLQAANGEENEEVDLPESQRKVVMPSRLDEAKQIAARRRQLIQRRLGLDQERVPNDITSLGPASMVG